MSFKMKFVAAALAFGATAVNAQSYDYKKEFAENPEGAKAASCVATFLSMASVVGGNDPRFKVYQDSSLVALAAADKAYRDPKVSSNKINDAGMFFAQGLGKARSFNAEASYIAILQDLARTCERDYPKEIKLEVK